jgi:hypothetical protein
MTDNHARARQVVIALLAEGVVPAPDADWLEAHLRECQACAALREDLRASVRVLRLREVTASPALIEVTEWRLHARARELAASRSLEAPLLAAVLLGLVTSMATAAGLLRVLAVFAARAGVSVPVAIAIGVAIWFLPASLAALVGLLSNAQRPMTPTVAMEVEP